MQCIGTSRLWRVFKKQLSLETSSTASSSCLEWMKCVRHETIVILSRLFVWQRQELLQHSTDNDVDTLAFRVKSFSSCEMKDDECDVVEGWNTWNYFDGDVEKTLNWILMTLIKCWSGVMFFRVDSSRSDRLRSRYCEQLVDLGFWLSGYLA